MIFHYRMKGADLEVGATCSGCKKVLAAKVPFNKALQVTAKALRVDTEGQLEIGGHYFGCDSPTDCPHRLATEEKGVENGP